MKYEHQAGRFDPRQDARNSGVIQLGHSNEFFPDAPAPAGRADDRLQKVEQWINRHQNSLDRKKADDAKKPTFKIGGRIHADYWGFADSSPAIGFFENPIAASSSFGHDPENRFLFRRIRLGMGGDIFETMMWRT
ncbi:MAG: hypothetical protein IID45_10650, partial [Planctomycetes bacterium]|nr:hypothetical protein [Planctomycetota bacterium]